MKSQLFQLILLVNMEIGQKTHVRTQLCTQDWLLISAASKNIYKILSTAITIFITILFHLSLHAPVSLTLTFSITVFVKCLSWVILGWHQVSLQSNQHNSPHSPIMHSLPCESEERQCTAPTCLLPRRCHCVPTHHQSTSLTEGLYVLILYSWWTGQERWMNYFTVRCGG